MKWSEAVRLQESLDWSTPQRIAPIPTVPDASNALECTVCQITLASVAEASAHRLSKAHTGNLRRKLQGLPPLVLLPSVSTSSLSDSSSSDSSSEDDSEEAVTPLTTEEPDLLVSSSGSPFVQVTILRSHTGLFWDAPIDSKTSRLTLKIYKQLLLSSRDQSRTDLSMDIVKKELNIICTPSHTWTLLMVASGHFAGAVIDASGKTLVHKTHHRYTTRRKQGGGQAGKDGSGKIANSAGSTLRRYNEQALKADAHQLLQEWKPYIASSSLIFVRAKHANRSVLEVPGVLDFGSDPRIRSFPFTTGRPTLEELKRAWEELSTVKIELQCMESVSMKEIDQETLPVAPAPTVTKLPIEKLSLEQPSQEPSQEFTKASDLIRRGKVDLLNAVLQGYPALLAESTVDGNTLLHLAAAQSQPDIVLALLQLGSDASLKNSRKQTPYQSATAKPTRDVFRRFIADVTPTWDWKEAMIPGPLTKEMEESQKAKEKEKRRKNKEKSAASKKNNREEEEVEAPPSPSTTKKKGKNSLGLLSSTDLQSIGVSQERRKLLDREKRALAAEARVRSAARQCAACGKPMEGTIGFDKGGFKYCSMDCVKAHIGLHDPV